MTANLSRQTPAPSQSGKRASASAPRGPGYYLDGSFYPTESDDPLNGKSLTLKCASGAEGCFFATPDPTTPAPAAPGVPAVTVTDIATFYPPLPTITLEPDGWAIVNLPVNITVPAQTSVVGGVLLGQPAQVRFTPTDIAWNWGDGSTSTTPTGGGSWDELGVPEFTATDLSHTYRSRGTFTATPILHFTAEYSINGSPWAPVDGVVASPLPAQVIPVFRETTVLVARDCLQDPTGPGC